MVPWWKRILYSIVAAVPAILVCTAASWLIATKGSFEASDWGLVGLIFLSSIPGWLAGLPFVLLVKRADGPRFPMLLAGGIGIGLVTFMAEAYYVFAREFEVTDFGFFWSELPSMTGFATKLSLAIGIAALTSLIFLILLRRALDAAGSDGDAADRGQGGSFLNLNS